MESDLTLTLFDKRVSIPPKMLLEIASGLEEGREIAARYEYTTREWEEMSAQDGFKKQVAALTAEMKLNGVTYQRKAALLAEDLLEQVYALAKNSKTLADVLGAARFFASMGRLEPSSAEKGGGGSGNQFQITFNFSGQAGEAPKAVQVTPALLATLNSDLGIPDGDSAHASD